MCSKTNSKGVANTEENNKKETVVPSIDSTKASVDQTKPSMQLRRRNKRIKQKDDAFVALQKHNASVRREDEAATSAVPTTSTSSPTRSKKRRSRAKAKHEADKPTGGVEAILPSLAIVGVLGFAAMAKMGFRGRVDVAGIDLGTTNSVVCVQALSTEGGVGKIDCVPDPANGSPIVPSVVSFLDHAPGHGGGSSRSSSSGKVAKKPNVVVGHEAKLRIDTHPHHTLYHAKRVIGRPYGHDVVKALMEEVEFNVIAAPPPKDEDGGDSDSTSSADSADDVAFQVPYHTTDEKGADAHKHLYIKPHEVGSYIVDHLISITKKFLGHENVKTAVIAIPAKFDEAQRVATVKAFTDAGVKVARILEEPTAAALAYGLDKKDGVNYIMVYDFGGGTLDVCVLHVSDGGYVDVMGSDGDNRLGGADFDAAVAHALLEKDNGDKVVQRVTDTLERIEQKLKNEGIVAAEDDLEELLAEGCPVLEEVPPCTLSSFHTIGEKMKISLSAFPDGGGVVEETCLGLPADTKSSPETISEFCSALKSTKLTLTSKEYDAAVVDLYRRSMLPIQRILKDLNLEKSEIDEVVMVGGTTRMPKIRSMVQEVLEVKSLNTHIDPDLTVAYGAASVID